MFVLGGIIIYNLTRTEEWLQRKYFKHDITNASDLTLENLSSMFHVNVFKFPMSARFDVFDGRSFIVVDSRAEEQNQREQFFHELCHVAFHGGHQSNMHDPYRQLLEWEADNFAMYAALPYFMICQYDLTDEFLIHKLLEDFKVTPELCKRRLYQIKSRIQSNIGLVAEATISYNNFN